ncbi:FAD/NAD(P)-binding domain-containing protein [Pluteus cervinus]|uniref:FAD/NAD(P)-binding domain-containing protein n=1 Tax=Pluteus cervinus TaxID=181527 RepID=A0ACD3AE02_9AGAR|nr:FAD/NAD(P)-binding domain-containing protein [Pluteus cervinus]
MDYLKTVHSTQPSFHYRVGKDPVLPPQSVPKTPASSWGFPQPGPQAPSPAYATAKHYFVDDNTWDAILDHGEFDDIVCGSGFCALAYVDAALKRDPFRKILILERGGFWLPEHFQNLPLPFKLLLGGPSETFPWQLTSKTYNNPVKYMHGSCPFFGGRSTFWSAWCPKPEADLMRGFPKSMLDTAAKEEFWDEAEDLLHVTPANEIDDPIFDGLQDIIDDRLLKGVPQILGADSAIPAPLAVGMTTSMSKLSFNKFSTPGPLLKLYERQRHLAQEHRGHPLMIATDTIVQRFEVDPEDHERPVNILHTSRGSLCFPQGKTNIILATGAIPATTILMNSLGDTLENRAGTRLSGHFLSHVTARFPMNTPRGIDNCIFKDHLEIGASYVAGKDEKTGHQYHIQVTAIHSPHPETDAEDAGRLCPDYAAAATVDQLKDSTDHVVLVCATLGELSETNEHSWIRQNLKNSDVTTNIRLQVDVNKTDEDLWTVMDTATYDAIKVMAGDRAGRLEYWHNKTSSWEEDPAPVSEIRVPGVVHETSTLYMSDDLENDPHASVGPDYRPRGCGNVYVTGGAIFPSSGSWNPTLTMCGYAQDLARKLVPESGEEA